MIHRSSPPRGFLAAFSVPASWRVPGFAVHAFAVAALCALLLGCGVSPRPEFSASECDNELDEDNDDRTDCDDPDCWVYERCSATAMRTDKDAEVVPQVDAGMSLPEADAAMSLPEEDAGTAALDAGGPVDPCESIRCQAGFVCNSVGNCVRDAFPVELELRVASASVSIADSLSTCWDITCANGISIPNFVCTCPPDTYVTVLRNGAVMGRSSTIKDKLEPVWPATEAPIRVRLESPADVITFVVADQDTASSQQIFVCNPSLENLDSANTLSCTEPFAAIQPIGGMFRVVANMQIVAPQ